MQLTTRFGKSVKIDEATSLLSRGLFTRKCVEVNLSKPLVSKFKLDKKK